MNNKPHIRLIFALSIVIPTLFVGCTPEEQDAYEKYCEGRDCGNDGDEPNSNSNVSATYTTYEYAPCCQCDEGRTGNSCETYMYNQFFRKDYNVDVSGITAFRIDPAIPIAVNPNVTTFKIIIATAEYGLITLDGNLALKSGAYPQFSDIKDLYVPVIEIPQQTIGTATILPGTISITPAQYHQFQKTDVGLNSDGVRPTTALIDMRIEGPTNYTINGVYNRVM